MASLWFHCLWLTPDLPFDFAQGRLGLHYAAALRLGRESLVSCSVDITGNSRFLVAALLGMTGWRKWDVIDTAEAAPFHNEIEFKGKSTDKINFTSEVNFTSKINFISKINFKGSGQKSSGSVWVVMQFGLREKPDEQEIPRPAGENAGTSG